MLYRPEAVFFRNTAKELHDPRIADLRWGVEDIIESTQAHLQQDSRVEARGWQ